MPKLNFNAQTGEIPSSETVEFSLFKGLADFAPCTISIDDFIESTQSNKYSKRVDEVRLAQGDNRKALKSLLPCVTVSGVYSGGDQPDNLVKHSGLICLDFNVQDNPFVPKRFDQVRDTISKDQFSLFTFRSAGGEGIAVICRIDPICHDRAFKALEMYFFKEYGLTVAQGCSKVNRFRFISADPNAFHNPNARLFHRYSLADAPKTLTALETLKEPIPESPKELVQSELKSIALPIIQGDTWVATPETARDPILENVIDAGDMLEVIAPSKMKKSFFALQLGLCAATGSDFLGWVMNGIHNVLYINLELKPAWQQRRLNNMVSNMAIPVELLGSIKFCNTRGLQVKNMMAAIAATVRAIKPTVIIIDPLYMMHDGDENVAHEMKPLVRDFGALMAESGAALISVHHDPKGKAGDRNIRDRGAGSSIFGRACDARITLTQHADDLNLLCVDVMARNFAPTEPVVCSFDGSFHLEEEAEYNPETSSTAKKRSKETTISVAKVADQAMVYLDDADKGIRTTTFRQEVLQGTMGLGIHKAKLVLKHLIDTGVVVKSLQYQRGYWVGTSEQIKERNSWIDKQKGNK